MNPMQNLRRFLSAAWLAATPLMLMLLLVALVIFVGIAHELAKYFLGVEAADALLMDVVTWVSIAIFIVAPVGFTAYAIVSLARWFVRRKKP